ncbi:LamG-like jellyroll fold domain-containing protein [Microtetraspora fusca]|uniref:LamG-like jellyroll fold domain-containing protein n=1 Tax=Microtetraspora fusca TaxID=1997 RepID=A0ABW6V8B7_MICFU
MNKSGSPPPFPLGGIGFRKLSGLMAAVITASLLTAGPVPAAADDTQPTPSPDPTTAPATTTFPKPEDPDADLRAAIAEAKKQNKPVEVLSKGTESSRSWAYPDGHITTDTYAGPARVKQADGSFQWIDTTLIERDGTFQPKTAKADIRFSQGGDTKLASLERDDKGQLFALEWPTPLPKPRIEGNKATYVGAAGPTADLVVTALATGFRHDVVLRERPTGPVEFRLPVRTKGLKLSETKIGGLKLTDAKGKTVASAAQPFMTEAPSNDAKTLPHQRGEIEASVVTEKDGGQVLVIKPDQAFLTDEKTTYPVTVDPTVSLTATTDAWVQARTGAADATGSELNIGTGTYYQSERKCSGSVCTYTNKIYPNFLRGYIGFGSTSAFAGKYVDSATIQLLGSYAGPCASRTLTALPITSSWSTSSLSWSSLPSTTSTGAVTITPSCSSSTVTSFNVTQMAKNWAAGSPSYGVELKSTEDSRSSWPDDPNPVTAQYWSFNSVESGQSPPKLTVNYLLPPEIPTVTGESIDSIAGNDAISRSSDVKVSYKSTSIDGKKIDYLVSISDPTRPIPVPPAPSPSPSPTSSPSPSPTSTAIPGLVAAYGMNEGSGTTVADASGSGNTGTASATSWTAGKYGKALSFNGTSSWVTVNDSPSLKLTNKITMEAWVKPTSISGWHTILMKEVSPDDGSYALYASITDNKGVPIGPGTDLQIGGYYDGSESLTKLPTNTWSHVAGTYDGTSTKIYVNGSFAGETTLSGDVATGAAPLRIGGNNPFGEYFNGLIDEVRIYNTALTQGQIQADMNTPVGAAPTPDNPPSAPGTVTAVAGPDTVNLSWGAALDDRGAVTYQVHRSKTAGFTPSTTTRVATVSELAYSDSGMVQGQYYYRVIAVDSAGQAGPASNEVSALTSAQLFPPVSGADSGQVVSNEFKLGSPDSFKFKVKACLTGIVPRMCNETPYYRITTDAPFAPTSLSISLEDPQNPILSGMVSRPSGGAVTAKFFLYNSAGLPVGAVPLGAVSVTGGERAEFAVPEGALQPGSAYTWKMQTCAVDICSPKSDAESFTVEGSDGSSEETADSVQRLTLRRDNFVIMSANVGATSCNGSPCSLTESDTIKIGGTGDNKQVTVVGVNFAEIPGSSIFTESLIDLGTPVCPEGPCPVNANVTVRPLDGEVTSDTKGSDVISMPGREARTAPLQTARFDVTGQEFAWFVVDTDSAAPVIFGDSAAEIQPSAVIAYAPPAPPSQVVNLKASPGDSGGIVSWGVPESNGSMSILQGYDVEVINQSGDVVSASETSEPTEIVDDLVNGSNYTIRVRARTNIGAGEWASTSLTPVDQGLDNLDYADLVEAYYKAQDTVLEGRVPDVWALPEAAPSAPLSAKLALLNALLLSEKQSMDSANVRRSNSAVTLTGVVMQAADANTVLVHARVEREWDIVSNDPQAQEPVTSRQSSERQTFAFQRDRRLSYEMGSADLHEDSSDLIVGDVTSQLSSMAGSPAVPPGCDGYLDITKKASAPILRPAKGAAIQTAVRSRWIKPNRCVDGTTWPIYKFSAATKMYTNSSFWTPKKKNSKGKWVIDKTQQSKNKYLYDHSRLDLVSNACFAVNTTNFTVGGEVAVEKGGGGVAVSGQATQNGNEACQPYQADGLVGAGVHELTLASGTLVARCWMSGGNTCDIKAYAHEGYPAFRMNYWETPSEDRQCHPVNPKKFNGCKKSKVLYGRKADTGFLTRSGDPY